MAGNKEAARKRTAKLLAKDPDHFKKLGAKGKKGGNRSPGSFKRGNKYAAIGGAAGKRKPTDKKPLYKLEEKEIEITDIKKV